ncbi:Proteasome-activating nucleotidase [groundwater metagenome]|uniref:Proteasome-activating nucleotidase n=1 Tax=groundwater metagenome TaxID=717931 RepID=A0A098EB38_9ZZZZ
MENNTNVNRGIKPGNIRLSGNEISRILEENIILRFENKKLQDEIGILAEEIKKFKNNTQKYPFPVATVRDVLEDGRIIVTINFGSEIVVTNRSDKKVQITDKVVLKNDFGAITEILPKSHQISLMNMDEKPDITYEDIGGLQEQKRAIKEVVELPLKNPEIFRKVGISPPKGVLLYGPPGTGKTLLAKAVANATDAKFIEVVASELAQKYLGEGGKLVREIFRYAKENAPAIIFIDEIDGIAHSRSGEVQGADREIQRTLAQLLAEMDGFKPLDRVKVIAATNRVDIVDNALLRPGRFDRLIEIPLCDYEGRKEIFKIYLNKMNTRDINIEELSRTENLSGAQIKGICTEAGLNAIRQNRDYVVWDDFANAIEKTEKNKMTNKFSIPVVQELYV